MENIRNLSSIGLVAVVLLAIFCLVNMPGTPVSANANIELQAPLVVARAQEGAISSFIEDEAGISAYFQSPSPIAINNDLKSLFRTIEAETSNYIIGSVPVPDYPESQDAHVYVHTDGWALVYYLSVDPVGKIFDWKRYDVAISVVPTKFEKILSVIAATVGVSSPTITFYDFRYPDATHLTMIAEHITVGSDSFDVNIPGSFSYYERSWSLGSDTYCPPSGCGHMYYYLDGVQIAHHKASGLVTSQGILTAAQLLPDTFHTIEMKSEKGHHVWGGLALVYRVP